MTTDKPLAAMVVPCQITTGDGTVLTGRHDLDLAWKWAEHECGAAWSEMSTTERTTDVAAALNALREAGQRR